ncbi:MAG TPA: ChbG/HpnK family deacetylase [Verrucomicrobiae bacterium]|jgi:predicted glycoside hydrolase/deacetylase ChbG (UPF0249 family)|nr:ChbG/HpnK family deacetylase [Verrucomicrobiae bacterium]
MIGANDGLLIINADDWGGWRKATDAALACFRAGRITSVTAMMFMADTERAAELAKAANLSVGLHVNLNQRFDGKVSAAVNENHEKVVRFLVKNKYAQLLYNPWLRQNFRHDFEAQLEEFRRLYGQEPSHIDGHQHKHLCLNMLLDRIIPAGKKVRRNFSFWPGEKSGLNRSYRAWVDRKLAKDHTITDYFFSLEQCLQNKRVGRVVDLAKSGKVELMTHPEKSPELDWLMSEDFLTSTRGLKLVDYTRL